MANAHSFPLLRLPNLAREHVVVVMDIREQYLFATLSQKSKRVAKNGLRRLPHTFRLEMEPDKINIEIQKDGNVRRFEFKIFPADVHGVVSDSRSLNRILFKVEDIQESSIEQLSFLLGLFNISRFDLHIFRFPTDFIKQVLATVKRLRITIFELIVELENVDNEMYGWTMENCRDVKRLLNCCPTTHNFQWDSQEPFCFEYLSLWSAPWLTLNHMTRLFMNCKFFEVNRNNTQFTIDDLNRFVKLWMNDSNMEYFEVMVKYSTNLDHILRDIEKEPVRRAFFENRLEEFEPGEAFKIQQECGKEAVVCIWGIRFNINTHFNNPKCDFWDIKEDEFP
ncbi:unnamed protein product [Caenorhabditis brenneri]